MTADPFQGFHQLAYVTNDLDRALARWSEHYGGAEFAVSRPTLELVDGGQVEIRCALAMIGALQVEIVEPVAGRDGLYRDALPSDGTFALRWHHVGFLLDTVDELDRTQAGLVADGHPLVLRGRNPGLAHFAYLDARATLGHYLEYFALDSDA